MAAAVYRAAVPDNTRGMPPQISPAGARNFSTAIAGMVSQASAGTSLARQPRSLSRMGRGDHAAADAHRCGSSLLRSFPEAIFRTCERLRAHARSEVLQMWAGLGLLQPRAKSASRGQRNRSAARRKFPATRWRQRWRFRESGAYTAAAVLSIAYDQPSRGARRKRGPSARTPRKPFEAICARRGRWREIGRWRRASAGGRCRVTGIRV